MYDPGLGRWLEEDPLGFEAGDSNLYRYVFNAPSQNVDPSGLEIPTVRYRIAPPLPDFASFGTIGNGYSARISILETGTRDQRNLVVSRLRETIPIYERALYALENYWDAIESKYALFGQISDPLWVGERTPGERRAFYIRNIRLVLSEFSRPDRTVYFTINTTPGLGAGSGANEAHGYVHPWGNTIFLNPRFFLGRRYDSPNAVALTGEALRQSQIDTMIWETGRLIPRLGANSAVRDTSNPGWWTDVISILSNDFEELRGMQPFLRRLGNDGPMMIGLPY